MIKNGESHRVKRVVNLINSAIMDALRRGKNIDIRLVSCPLTITKVEVSGDLKVAHCYFVPFNTKLSVDEIAEALKASKHTVRSYITEKIQLKYSPEIRFYFDHGVGNSNAVEALLKKLSHTT